MKEIIAGIVLALIASFLVAFFLTNNGPDTDPIEAKVCETCKKCSSCEPDFTKGFNDGLLVGSTEWPDDNQLISWCDQFGWSPKDKFVCNPVDNALRWPSDNQVVDWVGIWEVVELAVQEEKDKSDRTIKALQERIESLYQCNDPDPNARLKVIQRK